MNAFVTKIRAERDVLLLVNEKCGRPELCGLTGSAIDCWSRENRSIAPNVLDDLRHLAALIGCVSQRSGERFDQHHNNLSSKIAEKMAALQNSLG
jgi:hypothetical protein